ncbi:MAG: InlB B-repeat-containing protein [Clostridia bacterium]|nr:InlB B-repeat-containing protein [Clostridia bacterium]
MRKKKVLLALVGVCAGLCAFAACGEEDTTKTYQVTFKEAGFEDVVVKVKEGKASEIPKIQGSKTGYTIEWDLSNVDLSSVTENIVVESKSTPNKYTIEYDAKGGTVVSTTQAVVYDATYTLYEPTYEGYEFIAWRKDGEVFANTGTWTIDGDISLVAEWKQVFTVTFKQVGQPDIVRTVAKGETLTTAEVPAVQSRTGYNIEWNFEGVSLENITSNLVVNAKETPKKYTITYDAGEGAVSSPTQEVTYDSEYTLLTPTRSGYQFIRWLNGADGVDLKGTWKMDFENSLTLVAEWQEVVASTYTVTFVQAGQNNIVKTVNAGETLTDIPTPVAETGYTVEWDIDENAFTNIQSDLTINVKKTAKTYTVSYSVLGNAYGEPATVTYGKEFHLIKTVENLVGYEFKGWKYNETLIGTDGTEWKIDGASTIQLTAELQAKEYKIYYRVDGVNQGEPQTVKFGEAYELRTGVKAEYRFVKWQRTVEGVAADFVKTEKWSIAEDVILDAVMEKDTGKVTINLDIVHSCCSISSTTVEVDWGAETITLPTPECNHDEYTFKYWKYHNGEGYVKLEKISDIWTLIDEDATSVTLTAHWRRNWTNNH